MFKGFHKCPPIQRRYSAIARLMDTAIGLFVRPSTGLRAQHAAVAATQRRIGSKMRKIVAAKLAHLAQRVPRLERILPTAMRTRDGTPFPRRVAPSAIGVIGQTHSKSAKRRWIGCFPRPLGLIGGSRFDLCHRIPGKCLQFTMNTGCQIDRRRLVIKFRIADNLLYPLNALVTRRFRGKRRS